MKSMLSAGAVAAIALSASGAAHANLISIGLGQTASTPTTVATGDGSATFNASWGTFSLNTISAVGTPPLNEPALQTTSIDVKTTQPGPQTLYVWITEQGLSSPTGVNRFQSGFTANLFTGDVDFVKEFTYVDTTNGLYGGTTLASTKFTSAPVSASSIDLTPDLAALYSETAEYIVQVHGPGSANDTITINTVPEPASIALLGSALIGLGLVRRKGA